MEYEYVVEYTCSCGSGRKITHGIGDVMYDYDFLNNYYSDFVCQDCSEVINIDKIKEHKRTQNDSVVEVSEL